MLVPTLLSLLGCTPHDAEIDGELFVWLAANSSPTVDEGLLELDTAIRIDCVRGWNEDLATWDEGYAGPREGEVKEGSGWEEKFIGGDCAPTDKDCLALYDDLNASCEDIADMKIHTFLQGDGFYGFKDTLDPWRVEVVINSENAFQLALHHMLPGDQDFRVVWSIDPDFNPVECVGTTDGAAIEYADGAKWREEWSANQTDIDGDIYYLNAGAVQYNPSPQDNPYWVLPSPWLAGVANARIGSEQFWSHAPDYGVYDINEKTGEITPQPHFVIGGSGSEYVGSVGDYTGDGKEDPAIGHGEFDPENPDHQEYYRLFVEEINQMAHGDPDDPDAISFDEELAVVAGANYAGDTKFQHRVEGNEWRPVDHTQTGLDGWAELHSSWVIIDSGSKIEEGGDATGSFQIVMNGLTSGSALVVHGNFKTDKIKVDPWGYDYLEDDLRDINGTPFCGGEAYPD